MFNEVKNMEKEIVQDEIIAAIMNNTELKIMINNPVTMKRTAENIL